MYKNYVTHFPVFQKIFFKCGVVLHLTDILIMKIGNKCFVEMWINNRSLLYAYITALSVHLDYLIKLWAKLVVVLFDCIEKKTKFVYCVTLKLCPF